MPHARLALVAALAPVLLLAGCRPDAAVRNNANLHPDAAPGSAVPSGTPVDPATAGSISGTVSLAGKAPQRIRIDMSQDPACSLAPGDNLSEQYVVSGGHLANVYLFVKAGPPAAMNAAPSGPLTPVVLDQKGCRYIPHVIAVEHGEPVQFRNSDPTMHNIHTMPTVVGNQVVDVSEGPGSQPQLRTFDKPEIMMPVRCNNHPWMQAFLNVSPTPFFAVSAGNGSFTLSGLPAGTYTLAAVHEKLGEQDLQVTVQPHTTTTANVTFQAPAAP